MKTRLPSIFYHLGYALAAIALIVAIGLVLDPSLVYRPPVDLQKIAPGYLLELDSSNRYTLQVRANDHSIKCPGIDCPLNPDYKKLSKLKKLKQYPMVDDLLAPNAYHGRLFYRLETVVPDFAKSGSEIFYDVIGIRGKSWKFFVNGQPVSTGVGGLLDKGLRISTAKLTPGHPLVLGLEIETGTHLAPGLYHVSQQFLASETIAKLVRETYRSSDYSAVMPVAYAFAMFGLLAALGTFFTPFFYELIFYSSLVAAWTYRHLASNAVIEAPAFLPQDIVSIDAALRILLYGSMIGFFNLYFRFVPKYKTVIGSVTVVLSIFCYYSSTFGFVSFPIAVLKNQNLFLSIAMAFGCVAALLGYIAVSKKQGLFFRKFVTCVFSIILFVSSAAFFMRYLAGTVNLEVAEFLSSYAMRQVFSTWAHFVILGGGAAIALEWALVVLDRQKILQRFGMMVDHRLLSEITGSDKFVSRRCSSVIAMFVDLRSFTKLCDKGSPDEVIGTLNSFLGIVSQSIQEHGGIIDKFVGDGVMAFWGVPSPNDLDVSDAILATEAISRRIALLNVEREKLRQNNLAYGVGIHIGDAIFGAVGSEAYIDYTAIGPAVNIAARVQDMTKAMNATVLVTGSIFAKMFNQDNCVSKGIVAIRGVTAEVEIFEVINQRKAITPKMSVQKKVA